MGLSSRPRLALFFFATALTFSSLQSCKSRRDEQSDLAGGGYGVGAGGCAANVPTAKIYEGSDLISWVDGMPFSGDWQTEIKRRDNCLNAYLTDNDVGRARILGFNSEHPGTPADPAHTPALAWKWFTDHPVGFTGMPLVLLKTFLDLNPEDHPEGSELAKIARIWHKPSKYPFGNKATPFTLDHLGMGARPEDFRDGVLLPPHERKHALPSGLAYEGPATDKLEGSHLPSLIVSERLLSFKVFGAAELARAKLEANLDGSAPTSYADDLQAKRLQRSLGFDEVFFSCSGCHQGRVLVDQKVKFLPGMPNTEIEAQYYSKLLMLTAAELVESGFDVSQPIPVDPNKIKPKTKTVVALMRAMVDRARSRPEMFYGRSEEEIRRGRLQALHVAEKFPEVIKDLISTGVKTHFIYIVAAKQNSYKSSSPDIFENRIGQMDAFGIAAGLVGIHTRRPDNSFINFTFFQNPSSPLIKGFPGAANLPSFRGSLPKDDAGARIFRTMNEWLPQHPAAIDVRGLAFARDNALANWDGNQGASARTLASGTSATGDPRKVNVRIHEPLNPFINNLPPTPYPFTNVDLKIAAEGKAIFQQNCAGCHRPNNERIYTIAELGGIDANRSKITSEVTRFGLATINLESCVIYATQNAGKPGYNWCLPQGMDCKVPAKPPTAEPNPKWCKVEGDYNQLITEYFNDVPARIASNKNGYRADVLHGIWGRAPYLHNGSVPTLGHVLCPSVRPKKFIKGNINYDQKLVGFEWSEIPKSRYSTYDLIQVKEFDTSVDGRHNTGHLFGSPLCPKEIDGMDPVADRAKIEDAIAKSKAGKVIEFLKTL